MRREVVEIPIEEIAANRYQPRLEFNQESLMELAQSIRENGLIQPITVREKEEGGYEIIAGERRYRACRLAGFSAVPCTVMDADELKTAQLALVENIQRENLTAIEEAKAYLQIIRQSGMTQEEMAVRMGKSQSTIANKIRLLNLPEEIQEAISSRVITERHARALLKVDPEDQKEAFHKIVERGMNVHQSEIFLQQLSQKKKKEPEKKPVTRGFSRHIKIALNTVYQAVSMIQKTGIAVSTEEKETENEVIITVKFPK